MKKFTVAALILAVATVATITPAQAFEASADAYIGVYSKYLWRGFDLSEDDDFVVQPGADVSVGGFTMSWWANISEDTGNMNEVDWVLDYSTDLSDMFSLSVGNIFYDVDGVEDTNELYVSGTVNVLLSPALTVYYDYDEFKTVYTTLGVSHGFDFSEQLSLGLGATASYLADDEDGFGTDDDWFHNLELSASVDYAATENIGVSLSALFSTPLSDEAEDITGIDDEGTVGINVTYAF